MPKDVRSRNWIPLESRLPRRDTWVLVVCLSGLMQIGKLIVHEQSEGDDSPGQIDDLWEVSCCDASDLNDPDNPVTHWMPCPDPPPGRRRYRQHEILPPKRAGIFRDRKG